MHIQKVSIKTHRHSVPKVPIFMCAFLLFKQRSPQKGLPVSDILLDGETEDQSGMMSLQVNCPAVRECCRLNSFSKASHLCNRRRSNERKSCMILVMTLLSTRLPPSFNIGKREKQQSSTYNVFFCLELLQWAGPADATHAVAEV